LIRLAAMRNGREIGSVGFHEVAVGRHEGGDLLDLPGVAEGDDAGKGDVAAEGECAPGEVGTTGETVEEEGEGPLPRLFLEDGGHVVIGLAAVDNQWKTG